MSETTTRLRVGSDWLELPAGVDPRWFEPERPSDVENTADFRQAVAHAAYRLRELVPAADPEPVRVTEAELRGRSGIGLGDVATFGPGHGPLDLLTRIPGQDYVLTTDALRAIGDECDALADQYRSAARSANIRAHLSGLRPAFPMMTSSWEHELLATLLSLSKSAVEFQGSLGDHAESVARQWLAALQRHGLRSGVGKAVLLVVQQQRGVDPAEMDEMNLEHADLLTRETAAILLEIFEDCPAESGLSEDSGS